MNRPTKRTSGARLVGLLALLWLGLALIGPAHAGTKHYYYTDAQGTVLAKTDAQGNIIARYDYKPYGAKLPGPQTKGPTGYTGHVNDAETGLVYMQARYYDPVVGRFLSVDPVGPKPGNGFGFNRYTYANNNPYRFVDPNGANPGDLFNTPEEAALDALRYVNGTSIQTNHEYIGYIIVSGKQFVATLPVQASEDGGNASMPDGKKVVGDYHTHGHYSFKTKNGKFILTDAGHDNLGSDNYSGYDKERYEVLAGILGGYRGYLATPGGHFYVWYKGRRYDLVKIVQQQQEQEEKEREEERRREQQKQQRKGQKGRLQS